jgi:hypothetical protein
VSESQPEPQTELAALEARIASLRAELAELRAQRAGIEKRPVPREAQDLANEALRAKIAVARARLAELEATQPKPSRSLEATLRRQLMISGVLVALPGAITLGAIVVSWLTRPGEPQLDPWLWWVFALPLLLGIALIVRARSASYDADERRLDGDLL